MNDLISTPLIFPKIEPTNWDEWWSRWNDKAKLLRKTKKNHNRGSVMWKGFHIYKSPDIPPDSYGYLSEYVDCRDLLPNVYQNLDKLPIDVKFVQVVSSLTVVPPHVDFNTNELAIRTLMFNNNENSTFYYEVDNRRVYQTLPEDTNTWAYWDYKTRHGTDFNFVNFKILVMYYGPIKENLDLEPHVNAYRDYVISLPSQTS